jgi:biotin carboxyl carrier protein
MNVERFGSGVYLVDVDGRRETVYVAGSAAERWAFWRGRVFRRATGNPGAATAGRPYDHGVGGGRSADSPAHGVGAGGSARPPTGSMGAGSNTVAAPMPGTVLRVLVAPGDLVKRGTTLVLLEAMKMEIPLRAPRDGSVKTIACRVGDLVQPDVSLVELA